MQSPLSFFCCFDNHLSEDGFCTQSRPKANFFYLFIRGGEKSVCVSSRHPLYFANIRCFFLFGFFFTQPTFIVRLVTKKAVLYRIAGVAEAKKKGGKKSNRKNYQS